MKCKFVIMLFLLFTGGVLPISLSVYAQSTNFVVAIEISANNIIAIGSTSGTLTFQTNEGEIFATFEMQKAIPDLSWSTDGRYLAAPIGNHIYIWEVVGSSVQLFRIIEQNTEDIATVDWNPDPNQPLLIATTQQSATRVWNAITGELVLTVISSETLSASWNTAGTNFVTVGLGIKVWELSTANSIVGIDADSKYEVLSDWDHNHNRLATATYNLTSDLSYVTLWDMTTSPIITSQVNQHANLIEQVKWSPDGSLVASASQDGTIRVWNVLTNTSQYIIQENQPLLAFDWSPSGDLVYYDNLNQRLETVPSTIIISPTPTAVAWRPDSNQIAVGFADGQLQVMTSGGETVKQWTQHMSEISALRWSNNGAYLASSSYDGVVNVWDTTDWSLLTSFSSSSYPVGICWNSTSTHLYTIRFVELIAIVEIISIPDWQVLQSKEFGSVVDCSSRNSDTVMVFANAASSVVIADGETLDVLNNWSNPEPSGQGYSLTRAVWDITGNLVAAGSDNGTVRIWKATTGDILHTFQGSDTQDNTEISAIRALTFSNDGNYVLSVSGDFLRGWNITTGEMVVNQPFEATVISADWNSDGTTLAYMISNTAVPIIVSVPMPNLSLIYP